MKYLRSSWLLFVLVSAVKFVSPQNDFFDEELMLKSLPSNHVYAYFQFTTVWETAKETKACKL